MPIQASCKVVREAAVKVLDRLGQEMFEVIKYHLKRSYAISFAPDDESPLSLDQLHFALSVMLGDGTANNILKQIADELQERQIAE